MNYKVLYRKYRPKDFDSIVGQEYTIRLLKNAIMEDKIAHAYIFTGPRGTGKTSTAKIFAKTINCLNLKDGIPCGKCEICKNINENPDIVEIDAASNNGVDDVRELIENSRLASSISKYKVYIIDEFHMLSTSAFNALLLTLEEPPANVVFILATTDIQSVPITILSRCQRFDFKPISNDQIIDRLKYVCKEEKIKITDEAINEIALMSNGGLRDALSILDQVSAQDNKIEVEDIINNFGSVSSKKVEDLFRLYCESNINGFLEKIREFKKNGVDYRILINKLIDVIKNELIAIRLNNQKYNINFNILYDLVGELSNTLSNTKNVIDPYINIELILLKYTDSDVNVVDKSGDNVSRETIEVKKDNILNNNVVIDEPKKNVEDNMVKETNNDVENSDKNVENYFPGNKNTNKCLLNVKVRVNNCFVNAKKDYLTKIKEKWNDFLIYESNANKKIMSFILDTDIVVASDKYAVITNKMDSTVELINENIKSLEDDFKLFFNMEYRFVCLSESEWNKEKEQYVFNLKNKIKYSIIEEVEESDNAIENVEIDENADELEKLAAEIFDNNVEIK